MAAAVNGGVASGGGTSPSELAAMLRKSAEIVERRDFHPLLYQTMKALTAYAGDYAQGSTSKPATSGSGNNTPRQKEELSQSKTKSAFHDVPDSLLDGKQPQKGASHNNRSPRGGAAKKMGATGGAQFSSSASTASGKSQEKQHKGGFSKSLKGIRKGIEKLGADLIKDNNDDVPFDEQVWCEEHFTRGCACKSRKNMDKSKDSFAEQPESSPAKLNNESDKKSKPCFQRPINPNSNLIANGWIDQQRRSKMRVVWKDVLASLVEGRRPGEETTLWIQRQVVDPQTGKITGLEALHQIPMKWLEDVNYVDIYGDYRFTLKVYNFAEEFYFRTRDEQSAQSWVITLRSARDASLESIGRMPGNDEDKWTRKESPPKEMGLDSLEGTGRSQTDKTTVSVDAPTAQSGNGSSDQNRASPVYAQQQPQANSGRMKISELRAIAHGAGYNTRGMERIDLEKIAAIVSGSIPVPPAATEGSDSLRHSQQQEAMMRDSERRQREERERKEREREEQERAETLRREQQAEREKMAMEQQRKQQEEAQRQRQIEEIKRRQEEERLKRMAEIQATEEKRKQEEENMRREQQQQRTHIPTPPSSTHIPTPPNSGGAQFHQPQQQQQQQQQRSHIPTPPSSGGVPFQQQQHQQWGQPQQQQYHHWQQHQQQQQQAQYQQQTYANPHQPQQSQNPQFFNQNGGYQQSNFQQQQQQQQQQQPQQHASDSKYAKQMEEKSDEEQSAANTQIKRSILINWALQPPNLNVLRPIDQLITSIHTAMPPAFGVPGHNYFSKFTPIPHSDLVVSAAMGNHPDENKLKKAVRKVRVFLHPDKLPRDLSSEQSFMARMLWDITSDSWEEFMKHKDELDWIRN